MDIEDVPNVTNTLGVIIDLYEAALLEALTVTHQEGGLPQVAIVKTLHDYEETVADDIRDSNSGVEVVIYDSLESVPQSAYIYVSTGASSRHFRSVVDSEQKGKFCFMKRYYNYANANITDINGDVVRGRAQGGIDIYFNEKVQTRGERKIYAIEAAFPDLYMFKYNMSVELTDPPSEDTVAQKIYPKMDTIEEAPEPRSTAQPTAHPTGMHLSNMFGNAPASAGDSTLAFTNGNHAPDHNSFDLSKPLGTTTVPRYTATSQDNFVSRRAEPEEFTLLGGSPINEYSPAVIIAYNSLPEDAKRRLENAMLDMFLKKPVNKLVGQAKLGPHAKVILSVTSGFKKEHFRDFIVKNKNGAFRPQIYSDLFTDVSSAGQYPPILTTMMTCVLIQEFMGGIIFTGVSGEPGKYFTH